MHEILSEALNNIGFVNSEPFLLFFGSFYIVLGLSAFLSPKSWEDFIDLFIENDALSLMIGILVLPISLSIIFFFNDWDTLSSTIVMVIGYLLFLKALALLLCPSLLQFILKKN
ncbi:MAG: hypothetical protein KAJ86_00385, partial [Alphaproteobacteria bacterium]|nr:hypothetical protein [Alphaproteobacteria bacterium]